MSRKNTTFIGGNPTWANACVGDNGLPGYWEYAKGFSQAAVILIDTALQGRGIKYSVDEMVYPICFNMRHSVELRLKGAISELIQIEKCRGRDLQFDFAGSHHIGIIWEFFAEKAKSVDDRYELIVSKLDKKIADIAEVDATGQTFRYPVNTDSQKHLVDVAIINFVVLKQSFAELESALDVLHRLNCYLCDEYHWSSFTKRLSRKNLFEIADRLPPRKTWFDKSFGTIKEAVKKRFNIGSKELSEGIKLIETHYELAPRIGMSIPLLGVDETYIKEFFSHWFKQHDLPSDADQIEVIGSKSSFDGIFKELLKDVEIRREIWSTVKLVLTPEKLAGVSALFYFAHDLGFSENYAQIYSLHLQGAEASFAREQDSFRTEFFHLLDKTNAVYNILKSLYFLHKNDFADQLVAAYQLDEKFSWLDDARSRILFQKADYCGYPVN